MKILIKVTKDILRRSAGCGLLDVVSTSCAIAVAVREIFPIANVRSYCISMFRDRWIEIPLPNKAKQFISNFDMSTPEQRIAMPELSFEIDVPAEVIDSIGISQVYKILSESKTLELVRP